MHPTPPFHQHAPSLTSRLSNRTPIVLVVSFLVNDEPELIRQEIVRVASAVPLSAATVILLDPLASQGSVRGACWISFSTESENNPAPSPVLDRISTFTQ